MKTLLFFILLTIIGLPLRSWGQCAPPAPSCSGCTPLTSNNQNLSSGTYCVTTTVSNITIFAGAVVCLSGSGSLVNANLNGGTLIYNSGTLTNFNANSGDLRIHGTLSNPTSTGFNGARVIVENGGVLNMNNLDVNWNLVVDGGTINTANLFRINGSGSLCMANMGRISTQYFQNNRTNGTTAQSTKGCISIAQPQNGQTNLNNVLTSTSDVLVCLPGTFTPANLGSALVTTNCSGCSVAMPVTYANFRAQPQEKGVRLEWQTASEIHHSHFIVERSGNALDFLPISGNVIDPFGTRNELKTYRYIDEGVSLGTFYYRLKQVDNDGSFAYSKILSVSLGDQTRPIRVFPNPVVSQLTIELDMEETGPVDTELSDINGIQWLNQRNQKTGRNHTHALNVQTIPPGLYLVSVRIENRYFIQKITK